MRPVDGMVNVLDGVLVVSQQGVDPVEVGALHTGTSISGDVEVLLGAAQTA